VTIGRHCSQRGELDPAVGFPGFEQLNRIIEVADPIPTERPQPGAGSITGSVLRLRRHNDLPAMRSCHHPRRLVHGVCDVVIAAGIRQARVYAHSHRQLCAERPLFGRQCGLCRDASVHGRRGVGERDEERIALGLHLVAGEASPGVTKQGMVPVQRFDIGITQPAEQACRSFDVGEHKGHTPGRERPGNLVASNNLACPRAHTPSLADESGSRQEVSKQAGARCSWSSGGSSCG
jgi:hypothetical protein